MPAVNIKLSPVGVTITGFLILCVFYYLYSTWDSHSHSIPWDAGESFVKENSVSLKELLAACIQITQRGGKEVVAVSEAANLNEQSKGKTKEGAMELKTNGDMQSHRVMVHSLTKMFPTLSIISEERDDEKADLDLIESLKSTLPEIAFLVDDKRVDTSDVTVWIDPLDATQEYTEKLTEYVTTMACVAVLGKPQIGVIYKPFTKKTYWAWVNHGFSDALQHLLDQRSPKSRKEYASDRPNKVIVSRSHKGEVERIVKEAFGNETEVIAAGGAGYKVLKLVEGHVDAYIHVTAIKKWDICAGNAILDAINGRMTNILGADLHYLPDMQTVKNEEGLLASYKVDHEALSKSLQSRIYFANMDKQKSNG